MSSWSLKQAKYRGKGQGVEPNQGKHVPRLLVLMKGNSAGGLKGDLFPTVAEMLKHEEFDSEVVIVGECKSSTAVGMLYSIQRALWLILICAPTVPFSLLPFIFRRRHFLFEINNAIAKNGPPDLCLALSSCNDAGFTACVMHAVWNVRYVVWEHQTGYQRGKLSWHGKGMRRVTMKRAARAMAVSHELADAIRGSLGCADLTIQIMPNPIPARFMVPLSERTAGKGTHPVEELFTFGSWTRWRNIKRLDVLLEAFDMIRAKGIPARLKIAGPPQAAVSEACKSIQHIASVEYAGIINRENMVEFVDSCDCCVIPSDHETFGLPAIEAMSRGLPVLTTISGGPESIVTSKKLGLVVAPSDANVLADAMERIIQRRRLFNATEIRTHCENLYGPQHIKTKWALLVNELMAISGSAT